MTDGWTFECKVHFRNGANGRKRLREGEVPAPQPVIPGNLPRVARLVALAHRFGGLLRSGEVKDYTELARLAGVTRQRVTQIMNLLHLAPGIQEAILDLPRTLTGRDPICERDLRAIAAVPVWSKQRAMWRELAERASAEE
ncbi:MAG: hypothetical protein L0216_09565 [Planctomycetales bacterium]|nr:hypothetical protein [Planctomycetales bacterium]